MQVLSTIPDRFAGTEGERSMLHAVRARLPEGIPGKIEGFVAHVSPAFTLGLHAALLLLAGVLGFWNAPLGAFLCALVTLSLMGEGTGRFALIRSLFRKAASYNLVARLPAEPGSGAVVLTAPLDLPAWRPLKRRWLRWRPLQLVFAAALVVTSDLVLRTLAEPWGPRSLEMYVFSLGILGVTVAIGALAHRKAVGADEAGGPAVLIELIRRFTVRPVRGLDVWFAFTGCGRAFQGGIQAFLTLHAKSLPDPCLVVALDDPANPPLSAVVSEGSLWAQHQLPTGPALVERMRWTGLVIPPLDRAGATDARAALEMGFRALAFSGGEGKPTPEAAERVADVLETLVRWYAEDLARVAGTRPALEELARATAVPERVPEPVAVAEPAAEPVSAASVGLDDPSDREDLPPEGPGHTGEAT
jgi:hypothetical protein